MENRIIKIEDKPAKFKRTKIIVADVIEVVLSEDGYEKAIKKYPALTYNDIKDALEYFRLHRDEIFKIINEKFNEV